MARDYYDRDRTMWERSRDEVRSWFGDENAERRRLYDQRQAEWEEQSRARGNPYRSYDQRQEAADSEFDRDWDLDDRASYGPFRNDRPLGGRQASQRRPQYGGGRAGRYERQTYPGWGERYYPDHQYETGYGGEDFSGQGPADYRRADERIREDINELLTWDPRVDASGMTVEVADGVATLKGQVRNRWMKRRAEDLTERVRGVIDVHNHLSVGSSTGNTQAEDTAAERFS